MQTFFRDTIAAVATPPGIGGIAVIRISGPLAKPVLERIFEPFREEMPAFAPVRTNEMAARSAFAFRPRHMHYGFARGESGERLDTVLALYMPGPHSFTGEDVGEIHCHGGTGIAAAILEEIYSLGARQAEPGEFTRRAFLNGRIDLTQAEAIAEMISAPTKQGARLAAAKLDGTFSREVGRIRTSLDALRVQVILAVDFPDEDAELLNREGFSRTLEEALCSIVSLLQAYERAKLWREGALAVLAGPVNAGKSSLLNALLGRERAIVSPIPGTTRDYIEETVNLDGIPLRLVDTAGLREGGDLVEEEGIRRSWSLADEADLVIFVHDATCELQPAEKAFLEKQKGRCTRGQLLLVLNKAEALASDSSGAHSPVTESEDTRQCTADSVHSPNASRRPSLDEIIASPDLVASSIMRDEFLSSWPCHAVSARNGAGLDRLAGAIRKALLSLSIGQGDAYAGGDVAPNLRQSQLLRLARGEMTALSEALSEGHPADILGVHLDATMELLAEVTGSSDNEELLNRIFSEFCIGK